MPAEAGIQGVVVAEHRLATSVLWAPASAGATVK